MDVNQREWQSLHQSFLAYEQLSFAVKGVAVLSSMLLWQWSMSCLFTALCIFVIWFHEGIVRTAQTRISERLLSLEQALSQENKLNDGLYTHFEQHRPGIKGLLSAYIIASLKPTVAITYLALITLTFLESLL